MTDIAIRMEHISKQYKIGAQQGSLYSYRSLRESLSKTALTTWKRLRGMPRSDDRFIWALNDISYEIRRGESVGVIGRNGAGKSTILKILSRITKPTIGRVELFGRVGSLLEIGTGFHPELTGRENIFLNGAILGMSRRDIQNKFDEMVDFSEIGKFLDTPVKHYSSGMYVRLAFSVAAHLEPEILVVDEVLAVGDTAFQKKCLGKMDDVAESGRTVLFVSHNMATISALCEKCIYLEKGSVKAFGVTDDVIRDYLDDASSVAVQTSLSQRTDRRGDGRVRFANIRFLDGNTRHPLDVVMSGQPVFMEISYEAQNLSTPLERVIIGLAFFTSVGQFVMVLNSQMSSKAFEKLPPAGRVYCFIPRFPLMTGPFSVTATLNIKGVLMDQVENATTVEVESGDFFGTGIPNVYGRQGVYVDHEWGVE
ncbi:MAG: ABC transporter ATP-binding protein [Anaerolineales bacterium]|nr:ABC transporter ATP-binding protein [Anaerolineales bacterium]